MSRLLIVNADDLGLARGVTDGILDGHMSGVVTSASLMVNASDAARAAAAAASEAPGLSLGLHFVAPRDGDLDDVATASRAFGLQLECFRELVGHDPTHVDSHHHVHAQGERLPVFAELVRPLGVPLRHDGRVRYLGRFHGRTETGTRDLEAITPRSLLNLISSQIHEGYNELGCHPGRLSSDLSSSYTDERGVELETLSKPGLREEIEAAGVRLVSYADWGRA